MRISRYEIKHSTYISDGPELGNFRLPEFLGNMKEDHRKINKSCNHFKCNSNDTFAECDTKQNQIKHNIFFVYIHISVYIQKGITDPVPTQSE